jgi:electron transport complex protein RnfD
VPGKDIEIKFTGLRPGEKLYEEVLSNEENTIPTNHKKIKIAKVREYDFDSVSEQYDALVEIAKGNAPRLTDLLLGIQGGAIGEVCAVALLLGGAYLMIRRVITWHLPVTFVGTVFVLTFLFNGFDFMLALASILSGGLLLGAIFMATDYVTSPATPMGKVVFGVGAALITVVIRFWGNYPEGVSFAILLMNILTPYIDGWTTRKLFGGGKKA